MASERIKLFEADIDVDGIIKKSVELKNEMANLRDRQKELKDSGDTASETYVKLEARLKNVTREFGINQKQLSNLTAESGGTVTVTQKLITAMDREITTVSAAAKNNAELKKIRNEVNATTEEGKAVIEEINKKLDENTEFIKSNVSQLENQKIAIGDYKNQIKEAFSEMNIFNGGFTGFISRAQQAGGVMPLLGNGVKAVTSGIVGMTKASLAFIATPIGAVVAAIGLVLGLVINYLKNTQAGIDAVTAVTRPLSVVFDSLVGILQEVGKFLFEAFSNPKETMMDLADFVKNNLINRFKAFGVILEGIMDLDFKKISNGLLQATTGVEDVIGKVQKGAAATGAFFDEAIKRGQRIDELQKKLSKGEADFIDQQSLLKQELKEQNLIAEDQTKTIAEREAAASKSIEISREINAQQKERLELEREILELKAKSNDTSNAEKAEIAEKLAQIRESNAQQLEMETTQQNKLNAIRKQGADAAKKAFDEALKREELKLQVYLESQGIRKQTLEEELKLAQDIYERELAIEKKKLAAKKITQEEYDLFVLQSEKDLAQKRAEIAIDNAKRELDAHIEANKSKLEADKVLSDESVNNEVSRLAEIQDEKERFEKKRFEQGLINETEYQDNLLAIQQESLEKAKVLQDQYEEQQKADRQLRQELELQEELDRLEMEGATKYELEQERLQMQYDLDIERLAQQREEGLITEQEYNNRRKALDDQLRNGLEKNQEAIAENKISLAEMTLSNIAAIAGKESAVGKAVAVAQATIDTYKAAVAAYAAGVSVGGPVGLVLGPVSAALAVAAGLANIKKIVSTKAPKAERGAVFNIGGRRHSQGGTKFYGEDGTAFEAEKDEKMFILNRQASAAIGPLLSDINQQYGGVSLSRASSYLAAGGQVLRSAAKEVDARAASEMMRDAVREGSVQGTMQGSMEGSLQGSRQGSLEGSSRGTYSGIVDKETNEAIAAGANF